MSEETLTNSKSCKEVRNEVANKRLSLNEDRRVKQKSHSSDKPKVEQRSGDRRDVVDRRLQMDRRRGPGRRRSDERKAAEEGQMSDDQFEFLMAMNSYKKQNNRPFPTWTEVLEVTHALGYRKVADVEPLASFKKDEL